MKLNHSHVFFNGIKISLECNENKDIEDIQNNVYLNNINELNKNRYTRYDDDGIFKLPIDNTEYLYNKIYVHTKIQVIHPESELEQVITKVLNKATVLNLSKPDIIITFERNNGIAGLDDWYINRLYLKLSDYGDVTLNRCETVREDSFSIFNYDCVCNVEKLPLPNTTYVNVYEKFTEKDKEKISKYLKSFIDLMEEYFNRRLSNLKNNPEERKKI